MQAPMLAENTHQTSVILPSQTNRLEETILERYQSFRPFYSTIDFAQLVPEEFNSPYSTHSVSIPYTKLRVALVTTPPHLVIGTPSTCTPGPLRWKHELRIELPAHTTFVSVHYGGETGDVHWFSAEGSAHPVPSLSTLAGPGQTGHFYLVRHEGIRSLQLVGTGKMFLTTLTVDISTHGRSR